MLTVVLAGNPNTGKTSLFNALTGSYEYVGNWPGVTVEKKVGRLKSGPPDACLVDLPGVYSLCPLTRDEEVAVRSLMRDPVDAVLNVVDASRLRRNLQLTIQLLETGLSVVVALNMMDVARRRGQHIDVGRLSEHLGVPVLPVIARTGAGCVEVANRLAMADKVKPSGEWRLDYGPILEDAIDQIIRLIPREASAESKSPGRSLRWLALQYLEGNRVIREHLDQATGGKALRAVCEETARRLQAEGHPATGPERAIRTRRSEFLDRLARSCISQDPAAPKVSLTERVDRFVTDKWLGIPVFLLLMYLSFMFTFDWLGSPLSDLLDGFLAGPVTERTAEALLYLGVSQFIESLVLEGVIGGVGGVLVFLPQIFVLFFFLSLIEDSGYMARVALVMDRLAEKIGLSGKAFIPLVIGFGCNVPGVMAARTIEQPKERTLTILLTPLMSCSARLAVFSLFAAAFFDRHQAIVVLSLYVLGIAVSLVLAKVFSRFLYKNEPSPLIIELPPYRVPQWRTLWRSTWDKGKGFIVKAGTFIFGGAVLVWLLGAVGKGGVLVPMEESVLAMIGKGAAPLFEPLGFGTWQASVALLTGFFAKEVVVSTMNIIYAAPEGGSLAGALTAVFTPVQAFSFMAFLLMYVPCLATVAAIRKETNSAGWTWFSVLYSLAVAYLISLAIHLLGTLMFG